MSKQPHSLAEIRKFIKQARWIYGSIVLWIDRDSEDLEDHGMVRITKKQTREILRQLTDPGDRIMCEFDGSTLWIS